MVIVVLAIFVTGIYHMFILRVPYVPTPEKLATEMVRLAGLGAADTVYDLGAGDGRILLAAKRAQPGIRAVAVELAPTVWLLGLARTWLARQRIEWRMRSVLSVDLRDADVVFVYLLPSLMAKLKTKFDAELRKGTRVVSHAFRFRDLTPSQEVTVPWGRRSKTLLLYEW